MFLLLEFLPSGPQRLLELCGDAAASDRPTSYYVDSTFHAEQREARQMCRRTATVTAAQKRGSENNKSTKKAKSVAVVSSGDEVKAAASLTIGGYGAAAGFPLPAPSSNSARKKKTLSSNSASSSVGRETA